MSACTCVCVCVYAKFRCVCMHACANYMYTVAMLQQLQLLYCSYVAIAIGLFFGYSVKSDALSLCGVVYRSHVDCMNLYKISLTRCVGVYYI